MVELWLWGVLWAMFALVIMTWSARLAFRWGGLVQIVLALAIGGSCGLGLWILWDIFVVGAWPTYLGHLAIGVGGILVLLQRWLGTRLGKQG